MSRTHLSLLLVAVLATVGGCSSDKSKKRGAAAPTTSGTSNPNSGSTGNPNSGSTGNPNSGTTGAFLKNASVPVTATVSLHAYSTLRENSNVPDFVTSNAPGLENKLFLLQEEGTLQILQIDVTGVISADREITLPPNSQGPTVLGNRQFLAGLPEQLIIQDENTGLITTNGPNGESVIVFNPTTVAATADMTRIEFDGLGLNQVPQGWTNLNGDPIQGGMAFNLIQSAAIAGNKLVWCSINVDPQGIPNPGMIVGWDYDATTKTIDPNSGAIMATTEYVPTGMSRIQTAQGDVLLISSGVAPPITGYAPGAQVPPNAVDVIDPAAWAPLGWIDLPADLSGPIRRPLISADKQRAYIGSRGVIPMVHAIDLAGIENEIGNANPVDLSTRYLGSYDLPGGPTQDPSGQNGRPHIVAGLALSYTGTYLYATSRMDGQLFVIDLTEPGIAAANAAFIRGASVWDFTGMAELVVVRPGDPAAAFSGPSIFVTTSNLAQADRILPNVSVTIDSVQVDKH